MKRLSERDSALQASELELAELFACAEPYKADPFRKRRVMIKVLAGGPVSKASRVFKGALVATLLAITASAAAFGGDWAQSVFGAGPVESGEVAPPSPSPTPTPAVESAAVEPAPEAAKPDRATAPSVPPEPPPAAPRPGAKSAERARVKPGEDPRQVRDAIHALRADHDPARAQSLLNDYMKQNPNGVLAEDALALSIEAASARRDPRAKEYARRYLAKFPNGKYRALATRALEP